MLFTLAKLVASEVKVQVGMRDILDYCFKYDKKFFSIAYVNGILILNIYSGSENLLSFSSTVLSMQKEMIDRFIKIISGEYKI